VMSACRWNENLSPFCSVPTLRRNQKSPIQIEMGDPWSL
jgi:hypothetical protein